MIGRLWQKIPYGGPTSVQDDERAYYPDPEGPIEGRGITIVMFFFILLACSAPIILIVAARLGWF